ncbi:hypothetical protein FCV25MIE_08948 [Fagus crenata]
MGSNASKQEGGQKETSSPVGKKNLSASGLLRDTKKEKGNEITGDKKEKTSASGLLCETVAKKEKGNEIPGDKKEKTSASGLLRETVAKKEKGNEIPGDKKDKTSAAARIRDNESVKVQSLTQRNKENHGTIAAQSEGGPSAPDPLDGDKRKKVEQNNTQSEIQKASDGETAINPNPSEKTQKATPNVENDGKKSA